MAPYKICLFTIPASGHLNPLMPILKELLHSGQIELVVYLDEANRAKFEAIGAKFRAVKGDYEPFKRLNPNNVGTNMSEVLGDLVSCFYAIAEENTVYFTKELVREAPDMIIYDFLAMHVKLALRYYEKCYMDGKGLTESQRSKMAVCPDRPLATVVVFSPSFAMQNGVFPNNFEKKLRGGTTLKILWDFFRIFIIQLVFSIRYGVKLANFLENTPMQQPSFVHTVLTCVVPELQPRAHLLDQNKFKFVGSTLQESFVDPRVSEPVFEKIFSFFPVRSEQSEKADRLLVFASLGTVFNNSIHIYKAIVDGFKDSDSEDSEDQHSHFKLKDLTVVVSTGEKVLADFEAMIKTGEYELPENIVLVKSAPQVEILKRASLFVTHCGMNSVSESIHYSVPMVCVPIAADQPYVAYRVADELGLGVRLDRTTMVSGDVRRAVHKVLGSPDYFNRIKRLSGISREYNGVKNATKVILDILNKKNL